MDNTTVIVQQDDLSIILDKLIIKPFHIGVFSLHKEKESGLIFNSGYRIISILEGSLHFSFTNNSFEMNVGDLIILPAGTGYTLRTEDYAKASVLDFSMSEVTPVIGSLDLFHPQYYKSLLDQRQMANLIHSADVAKANHPGVYILIRGMILRILIVAMMRRSSESHIALPTSKPSATRNVVDACMQWLIHQDENDVSVGAMAEELNYSENHIYKSFMKELGISPKEYLMRRKLDHSVYLLRSTSDSISEIATDLGFSSSYHFSSAFRKLYGITPSQCRNGATSERSLYRLYNED